MKIILDTNVLVSGVFWSGVPGKVIEAWHGDRFEVLATEPILQEYDAVLQRVARQRNAPKELIEKTMSFVSSKAVMVIQAHLIKPFTTDPSDEKFIAAAIGGNADYIVSGDSDLLTAHLSFNFEVVSASKFLVRIQSKR